MSLSKYGSIIMQRERKSHLMAAATLVQKNWIKQQQTYQSRVGRTENEQREFESEKLVCLTKPRSPRNSPREERVCFAPTDLQMLEFDEEQEELEEEVVLDKDYRER
jgi:hypothetical protein